jgi:hypothetical protein
MTFADLVTADMNHRHKERVREGKAYTPADMPDWLFSLCRMLDVYRVHPPGKTYQTRPEEPELESADLEELGIRP